MTEYIAIPLLFIWLFGMSFMIGASWKRLVT